MVTSPEQTLLLALGFMAVTSLLGWGVYALWTWASRKR